ncbi:MAG: thiamine-phosphate kinase [Nitrospinae bacterium]|nr:thiamine-phosphate kinase [Nitrospinota bacterium]
MDLADLGEINLIKRLQSRLKYHPKQVIQGIGDDCAIYATSPGTHQIISTDALVENVHFNLQTHPPEKLGLKALAVNVSDIAATGGTPRIAVITLGLPKNFSVSFLDRFYSGLNKASEQYEVAWVGGDTVSSPKHFFINVTILGEVKKNRFFTRKGARAGDKIFVTGTLGDSALGLKILQSGTKINWNGPAAARKKLVQRHLVPTARIKESNWLVKSRLKVTAMIDISDGLAQDLNQVLTTNGVAATLQKSRLPASRHFAGFCRDNKLNPLNYLLYGGEDYELLFTLKREDVKKLKRQFLKAHAPVALIGEITEFPGKIVLERENGRRKVLKPSAGFNHFKRSLRK